MNEKKIHTTIEDFEEKKRLDEFIEEQRRTFKERSKAHMEMVNRVTNSTPKERFDLCMEYLRSEKENGRI